MALVTMATPDPDPDRPWGTEGYNDPKRIETWQALERQSILQRKALGMELSAEEQRIIAELDRGHNRVDPPFVVRDQETLLDNRARPPKRRRKKQAKPNKMREAIEYRDEENSLFD